MNVRVGAFREFDCSPTKVIFNFRRVQQYIAATPAGIEAVDCCADIEPPCGSQQQGKPGIDSSTFAVVREDTLGRIYLLLGLKAQGSDARFNGPRRPDPN
jgi:hypothetical protein